MSCEHMSCEHLSCELMSCEHLSCEHLSWNPHDHTVSEHFAKILQSQEIASRSAVEHLQNVQQQMKNRWNQTGYAPELKEGDVCWLHWPRISNPLTKLKLAAVFHGPMVIV